MGEREGMEGEEAVEVKAVVQGLRVHVMCVGGRLVVAVAVAVVRGVRQWWCSWGGSEQSSGTCADLPLGTTHKDWTSLPS